MSTPSGPTWLAGLVGLGLLLAWSHHQDRALRREIAALRDEVRSLAETSPGSDPVAATPAPATAGLSRSDLDGAMLSIRGEVAALRREIALRNGPAAAPATGASGGKSAAGADAVATPLTRQTLPAGFRSGFIESPGLPATVLGAFHQQLGDIPIKGAHVKQTEEGLFFATEARLADGRAIELAVDEAGNVRHRHLEMAFEALDPAVQQVAAATIGDLPIRRVSEVFENGQIRYRVQAKSPAGAHSLLLAPDGTVIQSQIERVQAKP